LNLRGSQRRGLKITISDVLAVEGVLHGNLVTLFQLCPELRRRRLREHPKSDEHYARQETVTTNVFEETVSLRVMEGAGNGKQGHVLFSVILDEEVDDIAFSIDHVCRCRSDSSNGLR